MARFYSASSSFVVILRRLEDVVMINSDKRSPIRFPSLRLSLYTLLPVSDVPFYPIHLPVLVINNATFAFLRIVSLNRLFGSCAFSPFVQAILFLSCCSRSIRNSLER